ncbi:MarR family winged helix-turn-helix transcriptional regulator [Tsukamurella sp. 1534]|uniref:MarR family winged helix-turn-helix transcriptional regulator n=1 Tax=Tsukamurella sp. 1534 TaxID=1151061 RepID=UPI0005941BD1|nr:MarR family transcriptional regulator [Tsukamurella sp. 1534]
MTQEADHHARIGYRIKEAQVAVRIRMEEELRPYGLSAAQYAALELIGRSPEASNAQLAREAFVTRQSMNTMLQALQRRGLVVRAETATSGRELPTALTPEGTALLRDAAAAVDAMEATAAEKLTADQQRQLLTGLELVIRSLRET